MRAGHADQFRSAAYVKVLSGSRFDMVSSGPLGGDEDRPSPAITMEGPGVPLSSCSADDLGSKGAPFSTAPAVVLTLLAGGPPGPPTGPIRRTHRIGPVRHAGASPVRRVKIVAGMRSAEDCYRSVRRYSAGVMPVACRNARVKLDCEENWL